MYRDLARRSLLSNEACDLSPRPFQGRDKEFFKAQALWEPATVQFVVPAQITWETDMMKGGLLWLIGIPLPIILILFFMGYLS
ncbi:hypothetical protein [Microvirga ossetica]|jgi:hypothetical protein|uniref:hypothetical protein n=1 Tax=Microvirga ossetica TaxID=1882682 RepID=UPI0013000A48|nr:hypothetical protein [Microvirga ossetica]